jgi:GNAT superfamily N-acetyltransferase
MQPTDAAAWADLLAAIREVDHDWEYFTAEELLDEFDDPDRDFENGSIAIVSGDRLVGYGYLLPRTSADPAHNMRYDGGVHPDFRGRGIGSAMIEWAETAAVPLHLQRFPGQPLWMYASCTSTNTDALALHEQRGFRPVRWFNGMISDLAAPLPEIKEMPGVEIVAWEPERSEAARLIRNESFHDHWGSIETTRERWDYFMGSPTFRPEFSFLAYSGTEPVGVVISHEYGGDPSATGRDLYVAIVGTLREHRKRGIARRWWQRP